MRLVWMVAGVVGALGLGLTQPQRRSVRLYPIDDAPKVPAFRAYRDAMQNAVDARDADRVLPMIHPEVRDGVGYTLRITTEQRRGEEHENWAALKELLRLGGTLTKGPNRVRGTGQRQYATREFCAPYVWSAYPAPVPDAVAGPIDPWVILGSQVAVRATPQEVIGEGMWLHYDLVQVFSAADPHAGAAQDWIGIMTPRNRLGYVAAHLIRDPNDYHACFGEFDGTWLMTEFRRGGG